MNTQTHSYNKPSSFDLAQLFSFLWRNKIRIILTIILLVSASFFHISKLPRYYKASSTILLDTDSQNLSLPDPVSTLTSGGDTQLETYIEYMNSRLFLADIVEDLNLTQYPEFRSKTEQASKQRHMEFAVSQLLYRLSISRLGETNLLKISFESLSPKTSADIVNRVGPAFFEFLDELNKKRADEATAWLTNHIAELQDKLSLAEQAYQEFLRENQMIDTSSQITIANREISSLIQRRGDNNKKIAQFERTLEQIELFKNDLDKIMSIPQFLNFPSLIEINSKIAEQGQRFAELKDRYKYKHPKYIQAQSNIDQLITEKRTIINQFIGAIKQDYDTLVLNRDSLNSQIDEAMTQLSELGADELKLNRLKREVVSTQKVYDAFLARLQETEILRELGQNEQYAVVDVATLPTSPSKPRLKLLVAVTILLATFLSTAFWLAISIIRDKESRYRNNLTKIGIQVLSTVPKVSASRLDKQLLKPNSHLELPSSFTEAIRSLRTSLMVSDKDVRVIVVASVQDGDGKSSIGISLAKAFGQLDKTLLIDADLRNPSLCKLSNMTAPHPGLTEFINRKQSFKACIEKVKGTQVTLLPSGKQPNDPLVELSKNRLSVLIERLSVFYERVIILAPPITDYSDGLVIAKNADAAVLVCDVENNSADDVSDSVQRLQDVGTTSVGVVFNRSKDIRVNKNSPSRLRALAISTTNKLKPKKA